MTVARELPELRDFIRGRRAALAGFMEQGAGLVLDGDILTVTARNDIYIRYLNDNKSGDRGACERASRPRDSSRAVGQRRGESRGRPSTMPLASNGLTRELPSAAAAAASNPVVAEQAAKETGAVETDRIDQRNCARIAGDRGCATRRDARGAAGGAGGSLGAKSVRYIGRAAGGIEDAEFSRCFGEGIKVIRCRRETRGKERSEWQK